MVDIFHDRIVWVDVGKLENDASILQKFGNLLSILGGDRTKLDYEDDERAVLDKFPKILKELRHEVSIFMKRLTPLTSI